MKLAALLLRNYDQISEGYCVLCEKENVESGKSRELQFIECKKHFNQFFDSGAVASWCMISIELIGHAELMSFLKLCSKQKTDRRQ